MIWDILGSVYLIGLGFFLYAFFTNLEAHSPQKFFSDVTHRLWLQDLFAIAILFTWPPWLLLYFLGAFPEE